MVAPPTLSLAQYRRLTLHAAALHLTPEEALQHLLDAPPPSPPGTRRTWQPHELEMLRNPANRPTDIARKTGRTVSSISNKRSKLLRAVAAEETQRLDP